MQPWRFRIVSETEAELLADPARLLPVTDPGGRFMLAGFGVLLELLTVAARAQGRELHADLAGAPLDHRADGPIAVATLRLEPGGATDLPVALVLSRRTSRLPYDGRPVEQPVLDELRALARGFGHVFEATSEPELVRWVLELNRDTLFYDLEDESARTEIGSWLRFSERRASAERDGFSPACLGFPGWLLRLFFRLPWVARLPLLAGRLRRTYFRTTEGTRTVGWLTGPFETPADWVCAGRLLGRIWLVLESHGLHLHPFGSVITNPTANARLRERFGVDETPWMLVRLGRSAGPPRSRRLRTDELLVR